MSEESSFKHDQFKDDKCHCPDPDPTEDEKKCLKCDGVDPVIVKKKVRKKK